MVVHDEYFPLVMATGKSFCNRVAERAQLKQNVLSNKHTLMLAPRRYGKTSLTHKVLQDLKMPGHSIDFFPVTDEESVFNIILNGVGVLLGQLVPNHKNLLQKLHAIFSYLNPTVELSLAGQRVRFQVDKKKRSPEDIIHVLQGLDKVACAYNKRAMLVMDEFQQLLFVRNSIALEGAIRHAVERSQSVCYIFSGSTRHLLQQMFDDNDRPLFKSCMKLTLGRISAVDYHTFINKAADDVWGVALSEGIIANILDYTQCHPHYVNMLCAKLWQSEEPITLAQVCDTWHYLVQADKPQVIQMVTKLSNNQRAMLIALVLKPTKSPTGQNFLNYSRLSSASANQALKVLIERDIVYLDQDNYFKVLDPLVAAALSQTN